MIVAHQGGWDEILLVALPIVLFAGLLWLANHRAEAKLREGTATIDSKPADATAGGAGDNAEEPGGP